MVNGEDGGGQSHDPPGEHDGKGAIKLALATITPDLDEDLVSLVRREGISPVEESWAQFEGTDGAGHVQDNPGEDAERHELHGDEGGEDVHDEEVYMHVKPDNHP